MDGADTATPVPRTRWRLRCRWRGSPLCLRICPRSDRWRCRLRLRRIRDACTAGRTGGPHTCGQADCQNLHAPVGWWMYAKVEHALEVQAAGVRVRIQIHHIVGASAGHPDEICFCAALGSAANSVRRTATRVAAAPSACCHRDGPQSVWGTISAHDDEQHRDRARHFQQRPPRRPAGATAQMRRGRRRRQCRAAQHLRGSQPEAGQDADAQ